MAPTVTSKRLQSDLGTQQAEEGRQPVRVRRPGRRRYQVTLNMGLIDADVHVLAARQLHFRATGRVGAALTAFKHTRRRQQLGAVANRCNRLAGGIESASRKEDVSSAPRTGELIVDRMRQPP